MVQRILLIIFLFVLALGLLAVAVFISAGYFNDNINAVTALLTTEPPLDQDLIEYIQNSEKIRRVIVTPGTQSDYQAQNDAIKKSLDAVFQTFDEKSFSTYVSLALYNYPESEGYDQSIAVRIEAADYGRMEEFTRNLVLNYSPRNPDQSQVFVDLQICNPGGTEFEKNNLLRALEDTQQKFLEMGYQTYIEEIPNATDSGEEQIGSLTIPGHYNLIVTKPAQGDQTYPTVIEIGANLDTGLTTPGAGNNAAGVAGLLEMAAVLKDYPNRHPWRFVIFVERGEDKIGSRLHVEQIPAETLKAALILDGIGWSEAEPGLMNCIAANDGLPFTTEIADSFNTIREIYKIGIGWRLCSSETPFSSEGSYWERQLPAVLSVGGLPYKNPTMDKCSDNMANLNLLNAYLTVQQNIGVLLMLDQAP